MAVLAMTQETDRPDQASPAGRKPETAGELPMDFLVNALNRAVVRKQAAETDEPDCEG
jgi:hypothetical protein